MIGGIERLEDSAGGFWETLIADWVTATMFAFILQGVWFGLTAFLAAQRPEWEAGITSASGSFLTIWVLGLFAGLGWGVKRALDARS